VKVTELLVSKNKYLSYKFFHC